MAYRVAHYLNQFFGGIGGEEHAGAAPVLRTAPVGPGVLLQQCLGSEATIAGTVICGDNRMAERAEETLPDVVEMIRGLHPDLLIAGPAFASGRYGLACAMVGASARRALGIPVVTGLSPENPGSEGLDAGDHRRHHGRHRHLVTRGRRGDGPARPQAPPEEPLGPADIEGYLPTGRRVNEFGDATGAERMVDMLVRRLRREPFTSEVVVPRFDGVTPAPPVRDLREIVLGIVTTSGVVRQGNPGGSRVVARHEVGPLQPGRSRPDVGRRVHVRARRLRQPARARRPQPDGAARRAARVGEGADASAGCTTRCGAPWAT